MIRQVQVQGVFAENTYYFIDPTTKAGFIIDPGAEAEIIYHFVTSYGWIIEKILLTHGHFDHFGAACELSELLHAPIYIYHADARYLTDTELNLSANTTKPITIPHYEELYDGEIIRSAHNSDFYLKVIPTPGHTPGSVTFYSPEENAAFVGDTLYQHGPGLTNFPGGDALKEQQSIVNKILTLPPDTVLLSGHSSPITVERQNKLLQRL